MKALLILLLLLLSGCKGLDFSNQETQLDFLHATTGTMAYDHWFDSVPFIPIIPSKK